MQFHKGMHPVRWILPHLYLNVCRLLQLQVLKYVDSTILTAVGIPQFQNSLPRCSDNRSPRFCARYVSTPAQLVPPTTSYINGRCSSFTYCKSLMNEQYLRLFLLQLPELIAPHRLSLWPARHPVASTFPSGCIASWRKFR